MKRLLLAAALAGSALECGAAPIASGRHWRLEVSGLACEGSGSLVTIGARIRYLGPKGLVEAPIVRLADGAGRQIAPRGLVWKSGSRQSTQWLSSGGIGGVQSEDLGEYEFRFDVRGAGGELSLEFGDLKAIGLTRGAIAPDRPCESLLPLAQLKVHRIAAGRESAAKARVYRAAYPCLAQGALRTLEARYPPYLPRQLLVFGRGYLPNARGIELPMGRAPAQPYAYSGVNELDAVENAARRALGADFPQYRSQLVASPADARKKYFAFNWGTQATASGNPLDSIGVYELRPCAG